MQGSGVKQLPTSTSIEQLFICQSTALWHLCGHACCYRRKGHRNKENVSVCPLTGRVASVTPGGQSAPETALVSSWFNRNGIGGGGGTGTYMGNSAASSLSLRLSNPFLERPESKHSKNLKDNRGIEGRSEYICMRFNVGGIQGRAMMMDGEAVNTDNFRIHHNSLSKSGNLQRAVNSGRLSDHDGVSTKRRILSLIEVRAIASTRAPALTFPHRTRSAISLATRALKVN